MSYAECHYAECRYAECCYAAWSYAECHLSSVVMLNAVMLNVVMLNVVAPQKSCQNLITFTFGGRSNKHFYSRNLHLLGFVLRWQHLSCTQAFRLTDFVTVVTYSCKMFTAFSSVFPTFFQNRWRRLGKIYKTFYNCKFETTIFYLTVLLSTCIIPGNPYWRESTINLLVLTTYYAILLKEKVQCCWSPCTYYLPPYFISPCFFPCVYYHGILTEGEG